MLALELFNSWFVLRYYTAFQQLSPVFAALPNFGKSDIF